MGAIRLTPDPVKIQGTRARSSAGQSICLLSRGSQVRILPGSPWLSLPQSRGLVGGPPSYLWARRSGASQPMLFHLSPSHRFCQPVRIFASIPVPSPFSTPQLPKVNSHRRSTSNSTPSAPGAEYVTPNDQPSFPSAQSISVALPLADPCKRPDASPPVAPPPADQCPVCAVPAHYACPCCGQAHCQRHLYDCPDCQLVFCGPCFDRHTLEGHWSDSQTAAALAGSRSHALGADHRNPAAQSAIAVPAKANPDNTLRPETNLHTAAINPLSKGQQYSLPILNKRSLPISNPFPRTFRRVLHSFCAAIKRLLLGLTLLPLRRLFSTLTATAPEAAQ